MDLHEIFRQDLLGTNKQITTLTNPINLTLLYSTNLPYPTILPYHYYHIIYIYTYTI